MSKKYTIQIVGYGAEIVQAKYSDEEMDKIMIYLNETGYELEEVTMENHFSEIIDDREIYDWFEQDDMGHYYGGEIDGCSLYINGEENDIHQMDEDGNITIEYNSHKITGKDNIITFIKSVASNCLHVVCRFIIVLFVLLFLTNIFLFLPLSNSSW